MSVAITNPADQTDPRPSNQPSAEIVLVPEDGRGVERLTARTVRVGRRGMVIEMASDLADEQHAWVEITLPNGESIRPLAQVTAVAQNWIALRFVHLFPDHQRTLDAWHVGRSTRAGY